MEKVLTFGGVFVRASDPKELSRWYADHLGLDIEEGWNGATLAGAPADTPLNVPGIWSAFPKDTTYFGQANNQTMINFVVESRDRMIEQLRNGGCDVDDRTEDNDYGYFGWVTDPEGNRIEIWQPPTSAPNGDESST